MPQSGARGQNRGHLRLFFFAFIFIVWNHSILTTGTVRVFLSLLTVGFSGPEWG